MSTDGGRPGPGELRPDELRIGDVERESAMQSLGEHMSAGRLDIEEFEERSTKVAAAKTRGELSVLFTDLPEPHPRLGGVVAAPSGGGTVANPPADGGVAQRIAAGAAGMMGMVWVATIVAMVVTGVGWLIFIPIGLTVCLGSAWGKSRQRDERDRERYERHRERYERHRERYERHAGRDD